MAGIPSLKWQANGYQAGLLTPHSPGGKIFVEHTFTIQFIHRILGWIL